MRFIKNIMICCTLLFTVAGCTKEYYEDGGTHQGRFNGSTMDYLATRPDYFDSLRKIIQLAGMEETLRSEEITFFAPPDNAVMRLLQLVNASLYDTGSDTIVNLKQIHADVWKNYLSMYIFPGKKSLEDYPQIDLSNIPVFPGQAYVSLQGKVMNIGVEYGNAGGIQYAGYRQLMLTFIPTTADPTSGWINAYVASSNIETDNAFVHVIRFSGSATTILGDHFFGFDPVRFLTDALDKGIGQP